MSTVMPQNELHRRAVQWIDDARREEPRKKLRDLLDEAGMRFNLGPRDSEFLEKFFKEETAQEGLRPS